MGVSNMVGEVYCGSAGARTGDGTQPIALDADDSWHAGSSFPRETASGLMGGGSMILLNAADRIENSETSLRFAILTPEGRPATLQPYMGMLGHAVVRRSDGGVFTHLHPSGTISMTAQELFARRGGGATTNAQSTAHLRSAGSADANAINEVAFPYAFPRPGDYRVWVQVRTGGRVLTGVFDMRVQLNK